MSLFGWLTGADDAAAAAEKAQKKNKREAYSGYGDIKGMYAPYVAGGGGAFQTLLDLAGENGAGAATAAKGQFKASPGYQFRLNQGIDAIDQSAASRGGLYSGRTLKALNDYGQGMASQEYGNWMDLLKGLATTGYGATGATAGARGNLTGQITGANTAIGDAQANASLTNGAFLQNLLFSGLNAAKAFI